LSSLTTILLEIDSSKSDIKKTARLEEKDYSNYLLTLYDNNFFDKAEERLIRPAWKLAGVTDIARIDKYSCHILGLLLGHSLGNNRLIRTSLTAIVADVNTKPHFVEGLIAIFQKETDDATLSIKRFA
jgi:hypothetical protein